MLAPWRRRVSGPDLGAWYASDRIETAIAEVAHHLRREALARAAKPGGQAALPGLSAPPAGRYRDIRGRRAGLLRSATDYGASQAFGEALRAAGEDGVLYDSLRHRGGVAICAYRPSKVLDVVQAEHFEVSVSVGDKRIEARRLAG